jgi:shikimate dehydrogenase
MFKQYGLIGYPLSHSFSAGYFNEKFKRENITGCTYTAFPLEDIASFPALLAANPALRGLSVTIPYKEKIIPFLDQLDPVAAVVGAVNCIRIGEDGKKTGFNTDVFGFRQSIKPFLEIQHEKALILGTGGASKAVRHVLSEIGIDCYFVSRTKTPEAQKTFSYEEVNEYVMKAFNLIVNCTPCGMFPDIENKPDLPYELTSPSHLFYDLIYNPAETAFLREGKKHGAATVNGLSMLQQQAEEAWRLWSL